MRLRFVYLLPGVAIAHALGIAVADAAVAGATTSALWAVGGLSLAVLTWRVPSVAACGLLVFAGALGAWNLAHRMERAAWRPRDGVLEATVSGLVCRRGVGATWVSAELCHVRRVERSDSDSLPPRRLRLVEDRDGPDGAFVAGLAPGERVRLRVRIRPIRTFRNPGSIRTARPLLRRGVGGQATLVHPALAVRLPGGGTWMPVGPVARVRERVGARLSETGPGGALLRALAVGDRSGLAAATRDAFARIGIAHLLAVSGLHLALASAGAYWLLRALLSRLGFLTRRFDVRGPAVCGAIGAGFLYALLTGWGVPAQRATVFLAAGGAALLVRRRTTGAHVMSCAALAILLRAPDQLFETGAQLSFAATTALLVARGSPAGRGGGQAAFGVRARLTRGLAAAVRVSATSIAATAPILAWAGARVPIAGLLVNAVAVPFTAIVLLPAALTGGVLAAAAPDAIPATRVEGLLVPAERIARAGLVAVHAIDGITAGLEPARGAEPRAGWAIAISCALAGGALWAASTRIRVLWATAVAVWLGVAPAATVGPPDAPPPPRIVAFDVGQGDAVLVQGREAAVLVDGGRSLPGGVDLGQRVVVPGLRALGVRSLDLVVATHADADHRGGLEAVLSALPTARLWLPRGAAGDAGFGALRAAARARGVPVVERGGHDPPIVIGDVTVRVLWPLGGTLPGRNDGSLVLRIDLGDKRVLLTGDIGGAAEERLLAEGAELRADVLKVAHHGSRASSKPAFLRAVGAEVAVVSAGCAALPTAEAWDRLRASGAATWWTGRDGAVLVDLEAAAGRTAVWGWSPEPRCLPPARR